MKLDTQLQFAQNIKTLRLHKSMSQLQMAKEFNLSRTSYAQYESGVNVNIKMSKSSEMKM